MIKSNNWEKHVPSLLKSYNDFHKNDFNETHKKTHILMVEGFSDKKLYKDFFEKGETALILEDKNIMTGCFPNLFIKMKNIKESDLDFSNVQFAIKFMEEFNKMATDRQYIDCYGFIDRDFYHDISKIKQINKTTEHDSETNLIRCCMPQYLNLDKVHDYKQAAIGVFCKVFRFCVNQGILEKTSFDYETQYENSGGFDEDKMGEIIWLSHSYFKDNCGSDSFVDKDFDKYIRDNSNCFDNRNFSDVLCLLHDFRVGFEVA